jgi:hypothetical protein
MKTISFDAISIEAIRAGKKTMTRRPVKEMGWDWEIELDHEGEPIQVQSQYPVVRWAVGDIAYVKTGWTDFDGKKHPAMFCPRSRSPFSIRITAHRVERLQEITPQDVEREGIQCEVLTYYVYQLYFRNRWDGIYGKRPPYRWEDNPLVEVLTFEVIEASR